MAGSIMCSMGDTLCTRGRIIIRMTCVAMSKPSSRGVLHSRFTSRHVGAVTLPRLDQHPQLPPHIRLRQLRIRVRDRVPREAVAAVTGV